MVLKGYIKQEDSISVTCCTSIPDISIGGVSLYNKLDGEFGLDPEVEFEGGDHKDPLIPIGVSYLILDKDPKNDDHDSVIGEWIVKKLYTEYVSGCYSEYTCGFGGYDFFIDGGHNIFDEILSHENKYIILRISDMRDLMIDSILDL